MKNLFRTLVFSMIFMTACAVIGCGPSSSTTAAKGDGMMKDDKMKGDGMMKDDKMKGDGMMKDDKMKGDGMMKGSSK